MSRTDIVIVCFEDGMEKEWDDFMSDAYNGTFLNTRRFLNYHPKERFIDHSLIFMKGGATVAVLPSCEIIMDGKRTLYSHSGSTFGGITFSKKYFCVGMIDTVLGILDEYVKKEGFEQVVLKQVPTLFSAGRVDSLSYFLNLYGYAKYEDLSFVIDLVAIAPDQLLELIKPKTRNKVRQGISQGLSCKYVEDEKSIAAFHDILTENLTKHKVTPIHSKVELLDLKARFPEAIQFLHCMHDGHLVAASMTWAFGKKVLHTQNLSIDYRYKDLRPNNYMIYFLIQDAIQKGFSHFSFGISTENQGRKLNFNLAEFKEGFVANGSLNSIYFKKFS